MIRGIGVDIVQIERVAPWLKNAHRLARHFHPRELEWCLAQNEGAAASLAARYAAREAFAKALGSGLRGLKLSDMWVDRDKQGRPFLCLKEGAQQAFERSGASTIHLSLSHERDYALAFVVIE